MFTTAVEQVDDWWEVEALYDLAFAPGRSALSSYRLREDVPPVGALCRLARDEAGVVVGAIRYWPINIVTDRDRIGALLLGPIAVHPVAQGAGLGALLMRETLAEAERLGYPRVLLVGDAPYYARFGFHQLDGIDMPPPTNPARVLGLELVPGAWRGVSGAVVRATG